MTSARASLHNERHDPCAAQRDEDERGHLRTRASSVNCIALGRGMAELRDRSLVCGGAVR